MAEKSAPAFLPNLASAIKTAHEEGEDLSTNTFVSLIDAVVRVFDYLGPLLQVARMDMNIKNNTLREATEPLVEPLPISSLVEADKRANKVTEKDSRARNLHRLTAVVTFMRVLLENFVRSREITVKEAATDAYQQSLAPVHPYMVRTAVWAGMYILPTRASFMQQIGETEDSALPHALEFLKYCKSVEDNIYKHYAGISMPTCQPSASILSALWGRGGGEQPQASSPQQAPQ
mmetsp:Transcript_13049/g.35538  ORF Transcript_13049/g.35538 Transcript_13049/m.35538 type:complete len:233 (+) Transcript_13049:52-750(+)|eukprot:CAMPEP_0202352974 /NCGR_PEP_ID=MMETSP1126-20121109/8937_1 /ASSEMBLY_ACC=CAM_ASM_000457 /TAXON_ID=3047 /ORGANISM="Dunaliella tertiolecta, Strain CCMP1320" /LENGTH=232 /DNA_ID=CAMNT_0048945263 /DNA_START=61 /DNA_END=759 /DNA_ORIENTATION=+